MHTGQNWICSYCGHAQAIDAARHSAKRRVIGINVQGWVLGSPGIEVDAAACANPKCGKLSLQITLYCQPTSASRPQFVQAWTLLPASSAKPQPDYIPEPVRRDYEEACAIRDLSPKASATLTRRCIQGIIRDFCGITKKRLIDEIRELRRRVDAGEVPVGVQPDTVDAIDRVREIGNIGAHMEADINLIIDVDPVEAQLLIELTELMFAEWYVAREQRRRLLAALGVVPPRSNSKRNSHPPNPEQVDAPSE